VTGGGLKADDMRALNHVRECESAEIALFISLETPIKGRIADAASAGCSESATGKKYPRMHLLTVFANDHPPDLNFKKAKEEANAAQKDLI
jgi:hypothetical protein